MGGMRALRRCAQPAYLSDARDIRTLLGPQIRCPCARFETQSQGEQNRTTPGGVRGRCHMLQRQKRKRAGFPGKVRGWRLQLTSSCGSASSSEPLRPLNVCEPEHTDACPSSSSLPPSRLFPRLGMFTQCDRVLPYLVGFGNLSPSSLFRASLRAPVQSGARGAVQAMVEGASVLWVKRGGTTNLHEGRESQTRALEPLDCLL